MEQAALVLNMNGEQQKQYTELFKDIGLLFFSVVKKLAENQMENARKRIEECKDELGTAKVIRKNRRGMKLV